MKSYEVYDSNPLDLTYYRIKTIDYDGYTEIFSPVSVRRSSSFEKTTIHALVPNPARDEVSVSIRSKFEEIVELTVVDINGKIIKTQRVGLEKNNNNIMLDLADVASGVYFVNINSNQSQDMKKLIVTK